MRNEIKLGGNSWEQATNSKKPPFKKAQSKIEW